MASNPTTIFHQGVELHYTVNGYGSKVLLAFHGFGQTQAHWQPLADVIGSAYTVYAFDLFFHGKSLWPFKDKPLSKSFWKELLEQLLTRYAIKQFSVAGFSLGGKFALVTLECFPEHVKEVILLAPDGIKTNFWYSLATWPQWTKPIFRHLTVKPKAFNNFARIVHKLRLADKGIIRFARSQMQSREQRKRVYYAWIVFKEMRPALSDIAKLINTRHIQLFMYLGQYDRIITTTNMQQFLQQIHTPTVQVLKTGHNHLIEEVAGVYTKATHWN
jgi:pimeloyl-ACP methyl ester carboxylesterase